VEIFVKRKSGILGLIIVAVVVMMAVLTSLDEYIFHRSLIRALLSTDPYEIDYNAVLEPPSHRHPLGTTALGRDVLARVIYGARVSILVGVLAVGISGAIGCTAGLVAGYFGGFLDSAIMRLVDVIIAFPSIVLAIAFVAFLGPSLVNVVLALSISGWVSYARIMRGEVLKRREEDYVAAARAIGASNLRIMAKHILPNSFAPIIVQATMGLGGMIIAEAGLSFLGLGVQPPTASWGEMLSRGREYVTTAWWLSVFPGAAIFFTVMGFNFLGDALRDVLDPRLRHERR